MESENVSETNNIQAEIVSVTNNECVKTKVTEYECV